MTSKLRRAAAPALIVCLLLLCSSADARAQSGNTLQGRLLLPSGNPPPNPVRVTLTLSGRRLYETFTDLSGRFSFSGLAKGIYEINAEGDGTTFETTSARAEVVSFGSAPQMFTQNVQLRLKKGAGESRAGVVSAEEFDADVPEAARAQYRKGAGQAIDDKPAEAIKHFEAAVRAHPKFYAAHLALGEQQNKLRRYDEAIAAYRSAGELKPERADPYVGIGIALVNLKRFDEAIKLLRRLVELDQNLAAPYLSLGYAEMMIGDYRPAEEHLLRAIELGSPAVARVYLANVYEQLDEPAKAVEHLQAYLKQNPQTPNAESVRGAVEKLRKKLKDKK